MAATQTKNGILMAAMMVATMVDVAPATAADDIRVAVPATSRRIVVSIPDRKLALIEETGDQRVVTVYRVAVGAAVSPSPIGAFTIVTRVPNPTYYKPGTIIAPGAANPIGTRWIGLSEKGYGIHGTDNPASIGFAQSHGCIRLKNADVERLFERVRAGDVVELHGERTAEIEQLFATK
jgi:lipoprotein-anchoring transpeptidase ErfK/SrfK